MTSILVSGIRADVAFGRMLIDAFGSAVRFVRELPKSQIGPLADLVIGVYAKGAEADQKAFDAWARTAGIPALSVELGTGEILLGPLALRGRAGCGHCARARMAAASAAASEVADGQTTADPVHDDALVAGSVLVNEIRAMMRGGFEESSLLDHVLVCDAKTGRASLHRVIPLSRCAICGGAPAGARTPGNAVRLSAEDSPEIVVKALAGWVDPRTGLISRIVLELPDDTHTEVPIVATASPQYTVDDDGSLRRLPLGWGKGLTLSAAILSAVGEAVERYAASQPDPARIIWERPDDLDREFLDPRVFALYTEAQYERGGFPCVRFDPEVRHPWVLGSWLGNDTPVWVPAVFAFLSLTLRREHHIC